MSTDNPSAFPVPQVPLSDQHGTWHDDVSQPGMSLRDWFAGQWISGHWQPEPFEDPTQHAAYAYRVADAMLAERAKQGGRGD